MCLLSGPGERAYIRYDVGRPTSRGLATGFPVCLALRLDGFVSVETVGFMARTLVTRPHHWNAAEVRVNVQLPTGGLKVQLQDETGRAFAGFGADFRCASALAWVGRRALVERQNGRAPV